MDYHRFLILPENELKSADGCFLRFIFGNIGAADEGAVVIFDCVCLWLFFVAIGGLFLIIGEDCDEDDGA